MRRRLTCYGLCLVVLPAVVPGCGPAEKAPVSQEKKNVEIGTLPGLGDPIGPLDDGRIRVAPPQDWVVPLRKTGFVIRFIESDRLTYPKIHVTATDYENIINVSKDNVDEFARQVAQSLKEDPKVTKLTEAVTPIAIGRLTGVTHARQAKDSKQRVVDLVFVETVVDGRKYTVALQALRGTRRKYRPHLHAVAGGIEFLKTETDESAKEDPQPAKDDEAGQKTDPQTQPPDTAPRV